MQDFEVSALKTGMLPTREIIEEIARLVKGNNLKNFVVDPVVRSTSGFDLIDDEALKRVDRTAFSAFRRDYAEHSRSRKNRAE